MNSDSDELVNSSGQPLRHTQTASTSEGTPPRSQEDEDLMEAIRQSLEESARTTQNLIPHYDTIPAISFSSDENSREERELLEALRMSLEVVDNEQYPMSDRSSCLSSERHDYLSNESSFSSQGPVNASDEWDMINAAVQQSEAPQPPIPRSPTPPPFIFGGVRQWIEENQNSDGRQDPSVEQNLEQNVQEAIRISIEHVDPSPPEMGPETAPEHQQLLLSPGPVNAEEEWNLMEAIRESGEIVDQWESYDQEPIYQNHHQNHRRNNWRHNHFQPWRQNQNQREDNREKEVVPVEIWKNLEEELNDVVEFLKIQEDDPVKIYRNLLTSPFVLKIFSEKDHGFRILHEIRTQKEQLEIDWSNFEMLKFVYSRHPMIREQIEKIMEQKSIMEDHIFRNIDNFINAHGATAFRTGALSIAIDFDEFPPTLTWRTTGNDTILLRPVVIDGVAILNATINDSSWRPFFGESGPVEQMMYDQDLNLPVKAIFDVIMNFLIRGHKTVVYLPKYYKNYLTEGGISKVDDIVAFRKLIDLNFIQFPDIKRQHHKAKWFNVVTEIADKTGAVFVSSIEYRPKAIIQSYEKPSDRIITPCFLNTNDRLMVLEPSIRYKEPDRRKYTTIRAKEILQFHEEEDDRDKLSEQLYLNKQIELICSLCQLYPTKSLHKVGIQQLLELVVNADSDFEMPQMDLETFMKLYTQFVNNDNQMHRI